jgi:hypothetical protein
MKQPPAPKAEIVVTLSAGSSALVVHAASPDAMNWALKAAETYGTVIKADARTFVLDVMPNYDAAEAAEYLRSYNEEEA